MRVVEIGLWVVVFQLSLGLVMASGFVSDGFAYDSELMSYNTQSEMSALSEWEQIGASVNVMNEVFNKVVFWGWIKDFTQPYYSQSATLKAFIDLLIIGLNICVGGLLVGGAIIEFYMKQHKVV